MGDHVESLTGELVNGDYFPLLGLRAEVGRLLGPDDDIAAGARIRSSFCHTTIGSARTAAIRTSLGNRCGSPGRQYTIVGVTPAVYSGMISGLAPRYSSRSK